jgi:hypothetical protein
VPPLPLGGNGKSTEEGHMTSSGEGGLPVAEIDTLAHVRESARGCNYAPVRYADYFSGRPDANDTDGA